MPFNDCLAFVSECGCGAKHVYEDRNKSFKAIRKDYDLYSWKVTQINYSFVEKEMNSQNIEKITVEICAQDTDKISLIHLNEKSVDFCLCEFLLFLMVNFEFSSETLIPFMDAIKQHQSCWAEYRYNDEMTALLNYLSEKPNTGQIIEYLKNCWYEKYPSWPLNC